MDANPGVADEIGYRSVEWAVEVVREFRQINETAQRLQAALPPGRKAELEQHGTGLGAVAGVMARVVRPSVIEEAHAWLVSTERALDMWVVGLSHPLCTVEDDETTDTRSGARVDAVEELAGLKEELATVRAEALEVRRLLTDHLSSCPGGEACPEARLAPEPAAPPQP